MIRKMIRFLLCFIPGAPHLNLGLKKQGVQLMTLFLIPLFLGDMLRIGAIMSVSPIIWAYSFFDGLRKTNGDEEVIDSDILVFRWLKEKGSLPKDNKLLAYGLIIIGVLLLLERILMPIIETYFSYRAGEFVQMGIVSILLILGGIKLLKGSKTEEREDELWEDGE